MIYTVNEQADFLRTPCREVLPTDDFAPIIEQLLGDVDRIGVGLAAPQIGHSVRIIVAQLDGPTRPFTIGLNPRFAAVRPKKVASIEGCLSIPGQQFQVLRFEEIIASWQDVTFKVRTKKLTGFPAFVFQHETGHTRGILACDIGMPISDAA